MEAAALKNRSDLTFGLIIKLKMKFQTLTNVRRSERSTCITLFELNFRLIRKT